jgi:hypothetical protein
VRLWARVCLAGHSQPPCSGGDQIKAQEVSLDLHERAVQRPQLAVLPLDSAQVGGHPPWAHALVNLLYILDSWNKPSCSCELKLLGAQSSPLYCRCHSIHLGAEVIKSVAQGWMYLRLLVCLVAALSTTQPCVTGCFRTCTGEVDVQSALGTQHRLTTSFSQDFSLGCLSLASCRS